MLLRQFGSGNCHNSDPITQHAALADQALAQAFRNARTFNKFKPEPVSDGTLRQLYDLAKWGPTSLNTQPGRSVFLRSEQAKQRLKPAVPGLPWQADVRVQPRLEGKHGLSQRGAYFIKFFPDGAWKANFLINLGYGDASGDYPHNPRLPFEVATQLL